MITVVIDHISWHEAQQEHTDNHNLNGGGCHYQSGFRLVIEATYARLDNDSSDGSIDAGGASDTYDTDDDDLGSD
jgi:hypothetical protein